tara:strand:- start:25615 stop:25824 length:210 start_codon:yes stop_codon:yes gene_type:complete
MLSQHDKYDITFNEGIFIDSRQEGESRFALYAIDKFFVEIEYRYLINKIENLRSFRYGALLDKYSNLEL